MVGVLVRGRMAWYLGVALGAVLLVLGVVLNYTWAVIAGAAFLVVAGIMLVLSYVTHGQTD